MIHVVIPEATETCKRLWASALEGGDLLSTFPGFLGNPAGIKGRRDDALADAVKKHIPLPEGTVPVVLSNGWTIQVPEEHVHVLSGS